MLPEGKKKAFNIVQDSGGFTYRSVLLLDSECNIGRSQVQQFIPCYGNALGDQSQSERSGPVSLDSSRVTTTNPDIARIEANASVAVVDRLPTYQ